MHCLRCLNSAWAAVSKGAKVPEGCRRRTTGILRKNAYLAQKATIMPVNTDLPDHIKLSLITIGYGWFGAAASEGWQAEGWGGLSQFGTVQIELINIAMGYWLYAILERSILADVHH
jgi:hypothetical protein